MFWAVLDSFEYPALSTLPCRHLGESVHLNGPTGCPKFRRALPRVYVDVRGPGGVLEAEEVACTVRGGGIQRLGVSALLRGRVENLRRRVRECTTAEAGLAA